MASIKGRKTFVGGSMFGSEAKGAVVGWLSRRYPYTAAVAAFPPSAGHTYCWDDKSIMVIMLPVGVVSPTVTELFIGPGALVDVARLEREIEIATELGVLQGKRILIHEHAGVVLPKHSQAEKDQGLTNIGSTVKGGMAAQIDRMARNPEDQWVAKKKLVGTSLEKYVVNRFEYLTALKKHDDVIVEGSQGFGLSMYHGFYPYTTARDTTPFAVMMDCGIPWAWAKHFETIWVARTYPIRVNNRTGSSGPAYPDSREISFDELGKPVELTTVTKLPRRIFTMSHLQLEHLRDQCSDQKSWIALTFADYVDADALGRIKADIERIGLPVKLINHGPHDSQMLCVDKTALELEGL